MLPKRQILSPIDMDKWKKSKALGEYLGFINQLNIAAQGTKLTDEFVVSEAVKNLMNILETLCNLIDDTPPIEQPQRFGNKAFKTWLTKVKERSKELVTICMKSEEPQSEKIEELAVYLGESFGNDTRIDYGTGHEMNFALFLMALFKCGALKSDDLKSVAIKVFNEYLRVARKLQLTYKMEPAGSHGVWSLDDFQFLPFIFGSGQLTNQMQIEPKDFVEQDKIDRYQNENMFFQSIKFITTVKHGPFAEHSNQLWNISSVQTWNKVNSGLIKMYQAEVLMKFPVVQHILFGSLIDISPM